MLRLDFCSELSNSKINDKMQTNLRELNKEDLDELYILYINNRYDLMEYSDIDTFKYIFGSDFIKTYVIKNENITLWAPRMDRKYDLRVM